MVSSSVKDGDRYVEEPPLSLYVHRVLDNYQGRHLVRERGLEWGGTGSRHEWVVRFPCTPKDKVRKHEGIHVLPRTNSRSLSRVSVGSPGLRDDREVVTINLVEEKLVNRNRKLISHSNSETSIKTTETSPDSLLRGIDKVKTCLFCFLSHVSLGFNVVNNDYFCSNLLHRN